MSTEPETPGGDAAAREARRARRMKALEALAAELPGYLSEGFPRFVVEVSLGALDSLRHYIEDPTEPDISWGNPWVEIRLSVPDFDWDRRGPYLFGRPPQGDYPRHAALYELTGRRHVRKRGETYQVKLLPAEEERLRALLEEERDAELDKLLQPVTFGAFELDADLPEDFEADLPGDYIRHFVRHAALVGAKRELPEDARRALAEGLFDFQIRTEDGTAVSGSVVLQFHPLVADEDAHEAYFPVVVGVVYHPLETTLAEWETPTFPDPTTWSDADRRTFWDTLLCEVFYHVTARAWRVGGEVSGGEFDVAARIAATLKTTEAGTTGTLKTLGTIPTPAETPPAARPGYAHVGHAGLGTVGPVAPERRGTFPLAFGLTVADEKVLEMVRHVHKVRLPAKKWSTLPSWSELCDRERDRLLTEEGERAFEDLRKTTGNANARGALLKRRSRGNGEEVVSLTADAERDLKIREGLGKGYRYVDPKSFGREYFMRLFQTGSGFVEVGLSWFGLAGPWVEEWRTELERQTKAAERNAQLDLFKELDDKRQAEVERLVARLHMLKDSRRLMEAVVAQVYKQRSTEVRFPAVAFRELLKLHKNPNWKTRVEGGLEGLRACEFRVESFGTGTKVRAYGAFLAEWRYHGAGPGGHGEGEYFLVVRPTFLGCLDAFESDRRKLSSGNEVLRLDFGKKLTEDAKAARGWGYDRKARERRTPESRFVHFDAGRVFYHAAADLSPHREHLANFLETELTRRSAAVSRLLGDYKRRKEKQVSPRARDAKEPRSYVIADCPLLEAETHYYAALGNFRRNPEAGRTLYGTRRRESATGGRHAEGLLAVMGYDLRPGGAVQERRRVVQAALEDLKAVVVDYLGGVVAARHAGRWLTLAEAATLNEEDLGKRVRWFLFVPETWAADRRRKWEEATGWTATEDTQEAHLALHEHVPTSGDMESGGLAGASLRLRLQAARNTRGLNTRQVAALFGVSHVTVQNWERGTEPDPDTGKVRGKPLPEELVPLLVRWVETGEAPRPEELAARTTRRSGVRASPDGDRR